MPACSSVNLALGDFLMLGAFGAIWLFSLIHLNPIAAVFVVVVVFIASGVPLY